MQLIKDHIYYKNISTSKTTVKTSDIKNMENNDFCVCVWGGCTSIFFKNCSIM